MRTVERRPRDEYLNVNGLRLHYLVWGKTSQKTMLLLHGFMAHAHAWGKFVLGFQDQYHIIALDQRGHGDSQWSEEEAYSLDDHFSDIANFIEVLELKDLILVGHSMGGRNALFYTACYPENVEKLVLIDARPADSVEASERLKHDLLNLPLQAFSLDEVAEAIQALYPYLSIEICHELASHGYKEKVLDGTFVPKYDVRMGFHCDQMGCITEDLWPFMKNVGCPTLIVRGEGSPFLSRKDAQKMSRIIPRAEWVEIPKATHMPVQENPAVFKRVMSHFLNKRSASTSQAPLCGRGSLPAGKQERAQ